MFVEALLPIGSAFDNLSRQDKLITEIKYNAVSSQQRADTAKLNAENRKRELDLIESGIRKAEINNAYGSVHLQMQPLKLPEEE